MNEESAAGPSKNPRVAKNDEYLFVTLMCQNNERMPAVATIFTNSDCSRSSARLAMNSEDPYDYTVFLESELWWMGMTRKAFFPLSFGVSSVMIPEGYAMKFSNQESLEGDK